MKRTWVIPAILATGLAGLGGLTQAAFAQDGDGRGSGYTCGQGGQGGNDGWSGRWNDDDRRGYGDQDSRWRDSDNDRGGYNSGEGRRSHGDCGQCGHGSGYHGRGYGMHGYDRDRGYDRRDGQSDQRNYRYDRRDGGRYDRDDSDRGYRGHGYHHRYHHRQEGRQENRQDSRQDSRQDDRRDGRSGPRRYGRGFDPARIESAKKEISVTEAQEQVWTKYASTLKEVADARKARRDSIDRSAIRRMSTEEHRKFRDSMIEQRRKEQDSVNAAVDELVNALDEKQAAIAREVLPGYAFGPWMMRGAGMGRSGGSGSGSGSGNR